MRRRVLILSLLAGFTAGCSGLRPYVSDDEKNLHISTRTEASGFLASVEAAVDIYSLDTACARQYLGTADLDSSMVHVGLPLNVPTYLSFVFASSAFLSSTQGSISYGTVLVPRDDYDYEATVSYVDNIYNVSIHESHSMTGERRELMPAPLESCGISD